MEQVTIYTMRTGRALQLLAAMLFTVGSLLFARGVFTYISVDSSGDDSSVVETPVMALPHLPIQRGSAQPEHYDGSRWTAPKKVLNTLGVVRVHMQYDGLCSGIPIVNTVYIVTAAHCLTNYDPANSNIDAASITPQAVYMSIDGTNINNPATSYTFHATYLTDTSEPALDVAVIATSRRWSYGVELGHVDDETVAVHAYGYQYVDAGGWRLTPENVERQLRIRGVGVANAVTRCSLDVETYRHFAHHGITCGMSPGASGGPVIATQRDGSYRLVGVVARASHHWRVTRFGDSSIVDELLDGGGIVIMSGAWPESWDAAGWPPALTPGYVLTRSAGDTSEMVVSESSDEHLAKDMCSSTYQSGEVCR